MNPQKDSLNNGFFSFVLAYLKKETEHYLSNVIQSSEFSIFGVNEELTYCKENCFEQYELQS